jgi:hypothetical protein
MTKLILIRSERIHVREIAQKQGTDIITIFVDTPVTIAHQRLLENRAAATRLDVTNDEWSAIVAAMEPPAAEEHAMIFRYGDSLSDWIEQNLSLLK